MRTGAGVRTGNADQNLAVVRHMAVNTLKQETTAKVGIKAKRKKAGWDYDYLLKDSLLKMRLPWGILFYDYATGQRLTAVLRATRRCQRGQRVLV